MGIEELKELEKNIPEAAPSPTEAAPSPTEATIPEKKKIKRRKKRLAGTRKQKLVRDTGGKFIPPGEEEPEEEVVVSDEDQKLFLPMVSNLTNLAFKRLNWSPLTYDEAKSLTNSLLPVYYKYLPAFLDKYSEELNLTLTLAMIIAPRFISKATFVPDEKQPTE